MILNVAKPKKLVSDWYLEYRDIIYDFACSILVFIFVVCLALAMGIIEL